MILDPAEVMPDVEDMSPVEVAETVEQVKEEHPVIARLTDLSETVVEAESTTADKKPAQTVKNLAESVAGDKRCVFVSRPDKTDRVFAALRDEFRRTDASERDDGMHRLYNRRPVKIDGETMLRPNSARETVWLQDPDDGTIHLTDSDGNEHAVFPDAESVRTDADKYPATTGDVDDEDMDLWAKVTEPYVPEDVFGGDLPSDDEWDVVSVPGDEEGAPKLVEQVDGEAKSVPLQDAATGESPNASEKKNREDTSTEQPQSDNDDTGTATEEFSATDYL
jgi:hypothetical protein